MPVETILLAVKPEEEHEFLVDAVLDVAEPTRATVVLGVVHSEESFEAANEDYGGRASPDELARRSKAVRVATDRLEEADVPYEVRGAVGDPGETFVSIGEETGADLLFVRGKKRSPTGKALFGSTAQTVLLNAHCPVTFVRQ